jgi:hypothetical protein
MSAQTLCASVSSPNAGGASCDKSMKKWKYLLKTEREFTPSEYASAALFIAAIRAAGLLARTDANKLFTFPIILNLDDNSTQNTTGNLGDGPIEVIQEGAFGATGGFKAGSRQVQNLRTLANGNSARYLAVDEDNVVWGYKKASGNYVGIKLDVFVNSDRPRFQGAVKGQTMTISASDPTEFANSRYLELTSSFVATDYGYLSDVQLYNKVAPSSNVFKIDALTQTAQVKETLGLQANFGATLASTSLWTCRNVTTGAAITLTSVAQDTGNGCYTVTVDSTAFGLLGSGALIEFNLAAPTALDAANVTGIEGLSFQYAKP